MDFINETGFPAEIARAQLLYRDLMLATIVAKAAFQVEPDGSVTRVPDQIPISEADVQTDLGTIDGDMVPIKPGCDLAVLGHACGPRQGELSDRLEVNLRIGTFQRKLAVFGDRVWKASGGNFRPTPPKPFTSMILTYDRAFGGEAFHDDKLKAPFFDNPRGKGYVRLEKHVEGTALPNVEESDQILSSWEQTPLPAGLAPIPRDSSLRIREGFDVDLENQTTQLGPGAFSFAHPRMRLEKYPLGESVVLKGMRPRPDWTFKLPILRFHVLVCLGDARYSLPLPVDTVCMFPDYSRFYVVARRAFVYQYLPQRIRIVRLVEGDAPTGGATTSIHEQRQAKAPAISIEPAVPPEQLPLPFDAFLSLYPLTRVVEQLALCISG